MNCCLGDLVSFFTDVVKPKTSKSESPRMRMRALSDKKTPSPMASDAHRSIGMHASSISLRASPFD